MAYNKNYKTLNPQTHWFLKTSKLFVIPILVVGLMMYFYGTATYESENLVIAVIIFLICISVFGTLIAIATKACTATESFEDAFAKHIGFEYLGTSFKSNQLEMRLKTFEDQHVVSGCFLPYSSYYLKQKDFQVQFCGLTSSYQGKHATCRSCCLIKDKQFEFPDFTLKSRGRMLRFIDFFTRRKKCFEYKGKNTKQVNDFFKSFELNSKILSHTGNITIEGRDKALLIICDAGIYAGNIEIIYGIWNEIYRLFSPNINLEDEQTATSLEQEDNSDINQTSTQRIRTSNCLENVKLEVTTPLEGFFDKIMISCILVIIIMALDIFGLKNPLGMPFINASLITLTVFSISLLLRRKLDCYYILDATSQSLLYYFDFLGIKKILNYGNFNEINAVTVDARLHGALNVNSSGWNYRVVIVLASGKLIPISNFLSNSFPHQCEQAKTFSRLTGAKYIKPIAEKVAKAKRESNGEYTLMHRPFLVMDSPVWFGIMVIGLMLAFFITVIIPGSHLVTEISNYYLLK